LIKTCNMTLICKKRQVRQSIHHSSWLYPRKKLMMLRNFLRKRKIKNKNHQMFRRMMMMALLILLSLLFKLILLLILKWMLRAKKKANQILKQTRKLRQKAKKKMMLELGIMLFRFKQWLIQWSKRQMEIKIEDQMNKKQVKLK
jgi:hypothetical protein